VDETDLPRVQRRQDSRIAGGAERIRIVIDPRRGVESEDQKIAGNDTLLLQNDAFRSWFSGSKIVDENGEPLVVYHSGDFNENEDGVFRVSKELGYHFGTERAATERDTNRQVENLADEVEIWEEDGRWYVDQEYLPDAPSSGFTDYDTARGYVLGEYEINFDPSVGAEPNMTRGYLNIKNPLYLNDHGLWDPEDVAKDVRSRGIDVPEGADLSEIKEAIKEAGYDGIVYDNKHEDKGSRSYIAFDSEPGTQQIRTSSSRPTLLTPPSSARGSATRRWSMRMVSRSWCITGQKS